MKRNIEYFEFSDSWVFNTLFAYDLNFKKINLVNIIAYGDALNHSILNPDEIRKGVEKLANKKLIEINEEKIKLTEISEKIKKKIMNEEVPFFDRIEKTLLEINKLNKETNKLELNEKMNLDFLNDSKFELAYKEYKTAANNV